MAYFAVIDTEINWVDAAMSIGVVIADSRDFRPVAGMYRLFPKECRIGGMYEKMLFLDTPVEPVLHPREEALAELRIWLEEASVTHIYAYNARFDRNHLPELGEFTWHDIMARAAYRQHNPHIPAQAPCFSTGRLKRGYGVEAMLRLLSGNEHYRETHNAYWDALDELEIMRLLAFPPECYASL